MSKVVAYVDGITSWWPPTAIAAGLGVPTYAEPNGYNVINLSFWTAQGGPVDAALLWSNAISYVGSDNPWGATTSDVQKAWAKKYHDAGVKVLVSAFGATETPTSRGYDPTTVATSLAQFVRANNLDGVDLDWEDTAAFEAGTGEDWLITCVRVLRQNLPQSEGYLITHAPQAPYFSPGKYKNGAYLTVNSQVGDLIDFYNIQFYNQGNSAYSTYNDLFVTSDGWANRTAVAEIITSGVNPSKIVVGKPVTPADATNTGYIPIDQFASFVSQAVNNLQWRGGVMGWQFSSDPSGSWSTALKNSLQTSLPPSAQPSAQPSARPALVTAILANNPPHSTSSSQSGSIALTIVHGPIVKRVLLDSTSGDFVPDLLSRVSSRLNEQMARECETSTKIEVNQLFWVDDESDVCALNNTDEVHECLRVCNEARLPVVLFTSDVQARNSIL